MAKGFDELLSAIKPTTPQGGRLFVACSGGRDSLSLAFACHLLYQDGRLDTRPTLLHVHHGMQAVNDEWASFVERWAKTWGFDCQILWVNLDKKTETHARDARYQALSSVMACGDVLLLAHHQDDQAETVLMRLMNGAGVQGLSGMKTWQNKTINNKTIRLYRPWLNIARKTITNFAKHHALPYVDDPTNDTADNVRGFLRSQILPRLHTINPKASANIARSAFIQANMATFVEELTAKWLKVCQDDHQSQPPFQSVLWVDKLLALSVSKRSALLHAWLGDMTNEQDAPNFRVVQDILALIARTDGDHKTQIVWQDRVICRYQNRLYAYRADVWAFFGSECAKASNVLACADTLFGGDTKSQPSVKTLCHINHLALVWQQDGMDISPLDRRTKLTLTHRQLTLSGKKLHQTLKIPPWLRDTLWLAHRDGVPVCVVAPCVSWALTQERGDFGARWQALPQSAYV